MDFSFGLFVSISVRDKREREREREREGGRERETFPRLIKISFYVLRDSFPSFSLSFLNRAFPFEESKSYTSVYDVQHIFPRCFASGSHVG